MDKLNEKLVTAWIELNSALKDSDMTKSLSYNQAIILKLLYDQYQLDHIGKVSYQYILEKTNFVKSLVNRTIDQLCEKGFVEKIKKGKNTYAQLISSQLDAFMEVHQNSLRIANLIIEKIGQQAAEEFIEVCNAVLQIDREELLEL